MKYTLLFLFSISISSFVIAQKDSSISVVAIDPIEEIPIRMNQPNNSHFFNRAWGPVLLAVISIDLLRDSTKYGLQERVRSVVADTFRTHVDDWIHYIPIVTMYTADLFKVPAKNTVWNQTKFLAISELVTSGIVWSLKVGLGIQRPNNGSYTAYPSGHTSQAFVQSQVLFNEFRETAPLLAASGFLFSISTGTLRVLNNRHWVPDVLLGAGIGMLVTNAVYYFEPFKNWDPFKNMRKNKSNLQMNFTPRFSTDFFGGNLRLTF